METKMKQILAWCKSYNVQIFRSETIDKTNQIIWGTENKDSDNSLDRFLEFLSNINPKFIILSYDTFIYSVLEDSIKATINELKEPNLKVELQRFKDLDNLLRTKDGQIFIIELSFVDNGIIFTFQEFAVWSDKFSEFKEIQDEYVGLELSRDRHLINKETLKVAKELSNFELFQKASNKPQRELAATIFFEGKKIGKQVIYNLSSIIEYADSIVKMKVGDYIE